MTVAIIPTGTANLASVMAAFDRLAADSRPTSDPAVVSSASHVVLPGVGSFGAAIESVDLSGLRGILLERIGAGRPTLAICVGMQLLAPSSEESDGSTGLGVVAGPVTRFGSSARVPQMGWNLVEPGPGSRFVTRGWAYFANSYRIESVSEDWVTSTTWHDGPFVSAMERGDVLACQFHPELSGAWGADLLDRWLHGKRCS